MTNQVIQEQAGKGKQQTSYRDPVTGKFVRPEPGTTLVGPGGQPLDDYGQPLPGYQAEQAQQQQETYAQAAARMRGQNEQQAQFDREYEAEEVQQLPPVPNRDEFIRQFMNAPEHSIRDRVREANRRNSGRVVYFARRDNIEEALMLGIDMTNDQEFACHQVEVDTALYIALSESQDYMQVDPEQGRVCGMDMMEPAYLPKFENFDDRDLETVAAHRNIDASNMSREQMISVLEAHSRMHHPAVINHLFKGVPALG